MRIATSTTLIALLLSGTASGQGYTAQGISGPGRLIVERNPAAPLEQPPGNVLIMLADDIGVDMIGAYGVGGDLPPTPNIDTLASQGVLFRNVWSNPVCSSTRATVLTGRFGVRTGIGWTSEAVDELSGLPLSELTLPEMLDAGTNGLYAHAAIGKWHLGDEAALGGVMSPNMAGFDHFAGARANLSDYFNWTQITNGVSTPKTTYATTVHVDEAVQWIQNAPEPWVCYLSFNNAHSPFHAPPAALHTQDLTGAGDPSANGRPYYKAMVEALDTEIGRLLSELDTELSDATVIFMGDNGTPVPVTVAPFIGFHAKGTVYDGGINVPFIVRSPRVKLPGTESAALANASDVFATVADLAGVDLDLVVPEKTQLDTVSIMPLIVNSALPSIREFIYAEAFLPNGEDAGLSLIDDPGVEVCQPDLGFQGPGTPTLTVCGEVLTPGNDASLLLTGAPPNAMVIMAESFFFNPTPAFGGTVTPLPAFAQTVFMTDGNGQLLIEEVALAGLNVSIYTQLVIEDITQPGGYVISNTLRLDHFPRNFKAIRDSRYKLIWGVNAGPMEFYDLELDPFESSDLLDDPLSPEQQESFDKLLGRLKRILANA